MVASHRLSKESEYRNGRGPENLFVQELNTTEKKAGQILRSAITLAQAMQGMKEYERFGIAGNREKFAKQILKELT